MSLAHTLHHLKRDFLLLRANLKCCTLLPVPQEYKEGRFLFKTADKDDYFQAKAFYHKYCGAGVPWLIKLWNKRFNKLCYLIKNEEGKVVGIAFFMFNEVEIKDLIVHELIIIIDEEYRGLSLSSKLQQYIKNSLKEGSINAISTCIEFGNQKALRSAQKVGFFILKQSAKPPAHYLLCKLKN